MSGLTASDQAALDASLEDSGCMGFRGDHPPLYAAANQILADHLADLAAAIDARADELAGNGPALGHPVLIERDGYVNGLRAAAEIVRAHTNP